MSDCPRCGGATHADCSCDARDVQIEQLRAERDKLRSDDDAIRAEHGWKRDGRDLPELVREVVEGRDALREALTYYAAPRQWSRMGSGAYVDVGGRARAALAQPEGEKDND